MKKEILLETLENLLSFIYWDENGDPYIVKEAKPELLKAAKIIYDMWE